MVERKIIGVDFSGSKDDVPWITIAGLERDHLKLESCEPIDREKLTNRLLAEDTGDAVVGMDFPFGVAEEVFPELSPRKSTLKDVWRRVAEKTDKDFYDICKKHSTIKRKFDESHYSKSLSPQNIRMMYMTYHGIKMLKELHEKCKTRWHIPPLHTGRASNGRVTLLEVMPGMALKAQNLPYTNYKNNKGPNARKNLENRKNIIEKLPCAFGINLLHLEKYRDLCIFNDDALDSIVAAVVAAMWARVEYKTLFHRPEDHTDAVLAAARLEGCIYAPRPNKQ